MDSATAPVLPPTPPAKSFGVLPWIGVAVGIFLAFANAWVWSGGVWTDESLGYALGGLIFPGLIAYAIAGRKKVYNPNRFGLWFCGLCLIFFLMELSHRPPNLKNRMGDLMREAAGTKLVVSKGSPMDVLIRAVFRDILQQQKAHQARVDAFSADLGKVYSAESFADKAAMQRSIDAVRGIVEADQDYGQQTASLPERVQKKVDATSLTKSEMQDFMKGVRQSWGNSKVLADQREAIAIEVQWAEKTIGLYQLPLANSGKIVVKGSKVLIKNAKVRSKFNKELEESKKLRSNFEKAMARLEQDSADIGHKYGLTLKDISHDSESGKPQ